MLEQKTLAIDETSLAYWDGGANSPTLLFLAGGLCDHRSWLPQLAALADTYRVVAFDPRGCGLSAQHGPYDIAQQARDAAHLIKTVIAEPVVVVAHSMGGYVALLLNHHHPQLVLATVFIDVPLSATGANTRRLTDALHAANSLAPLQRMVDSMGALAPSEVQTLLQAMMLTPAVEVAIGMLSGLEVVTDQLAALLAAAVTKPSLAIWPGPAPMGGDPAWLRAHYPALQQEFFDQVGHFVQLEEAAATNALLRRFVEDRVAAASLPRSTPLAQQMDPTLFAQATTAAANLPHLYGCMVLRNGYLIHEFYAPGKTRATVHHIRSITKSILSALVGIAIEQGLIADIDSPIVDILPPPPTGQVDPKLAQVTIRHLLTMTAGFLWDESDGPAVRDWFFGGKQTARNDALMRPIVHAPGTVFNYDSPTADLLATLLTQAVGRDLLSFAQEYLFGPLGIHDYVWEQDPAGNYRGSAGLVMRPMDLAKFGQLYLQQGQWQGQQLIPAAWVAASVATQAVVNPAYGYGHLWWVQEQETPHFYSAVGYGGQFILVAPDEQIVVVALHEWWEIAGDVAGKQSTDFHDQVFGKVLASVR